MEFSNMADKIDRNLAYRYEIDQQIPETPFSPYLKPLETPLSFYLEMGVFYLEESDS